MVKYLPANARDSRDESSIPESERSPGIRNGSPTPLFLLGKSHGQRSLVGFTPWDCKELDKTE